jgi:CubicO group peptidase (beta-lactamase class C family)
MLCCSVLIGFLCWISTVICFNDVDYNIRGTTATGWEPVRDLFKQNFAQGLDTGASVAIYHQGQLVVDLSGGWFDQSRTKPYDSDTLQLVFSTSKGVVAAAAALCVQQGLLDYSALVTKYWPEYGQNGKENTTVADILSHRAGLPEHPSSLEQLLNWTAMIQWLEQQTPIWSPGTAQGYHALTYGWLAGELIRRVDPKKRTVGQFIQNEIANQIQTELYIGLPPNQEPRVSPLDFTDVQTIPNGSMLDLYEFYNERRTHQAEIPAANGITNARSLAKFYASLIGDVDDQKGSRILKEEILKQATKSSPAVNKLDLVLQLPVSFGMGFMLYDQDFPQFGSGIFGHPGSFKSHISVL